MPSKLRLLLKAPNKELITGSQVVAALCKMVQRNLFQLQLPEGWAKMQTKERLKFLASSMPKGYELVMLREPKWARKNKSMYQAVIRGERPKNLFRTEVRTAEDVVFEPMQVDLQIPAPHFPWQRQPTTAQDVQNLERVLNEIPVQDRAMGNTTPVAGPLTVEDMWQRQQAHTQRRISVQRAARLERPNGNR